MQHPHSQCHDVWEATRAAGAADDGQSEVVDNNILKSECRMLSLLDLTISGAFPGSDWHLASTQVSSLYSNIIESIHSDSG